MNVAALTGIIGLAVVLIVHIVAVTVYMVKTNNKAVSAAETAQKAEERVNDLDERLRAVEREHVLGVALRDDFKELKGEMNAKFDELRKDRREDMRGLHDRLNDIIMVPKRAAE